MKMNFKTINGDLSHVEVNDSITTPCPKCNMGKSVKYEEKDGKRTPQGYCGFCEDDKA